MQYLDKFVHFEAWVGFRIQSCLMGNFGILIQIQALPYDLRSWLIENASISLDGIVKQTV